MPGTHSATASCATVSTSTSAGSQKESQNPRRPIPACVTKRTVAAGCLPYPGKVPDLSLIVAHITDTHFGHDAGRAVDRTRRVLDELMRMDPRPDVLVHSGDVTDHGHAAEYDEAVKELAAWEGPMVISPGNHDVRVPFVDAFCDGPATRATCARTVNGVRFLMLDSLIDEVDGVRQDAGLLGSDQLAWLDEQLRPTSHPPSSGCTTRRSSSASR